MTDENLYVSDDSIKQIIEQGAGTNGVTLYAMACNLRDARTKLAEFEGMVPEPRYDGNRHSALGYAVDSYEKDSDPKRVVEAAREFLTFLNGLDDAKVFEETDFASGKV